MDGFERTSFDGSDRPALRLVRDDEPTAGRLTFPPLPRSDAAERFDARQRALDALDRVSRRIDDLARAFDLPAPEGDPDGPRAA